MILNVYSGARAGRTITRAGMGDIPTHIPPAGFTAHALLNRRRPAALAVHRTNRVDRSQDFRGNGWGMGDVNSDAMQMLAAAGYAGECHYEAYIGPLAGGHNVCNIDGDDAGSAYGAELLAHPGGTDILTQELASGSWLVAQREAELAQIAQQNALLRSTGGVTTQSPAVQSYSGIQTPGTPAVNINAVYAGAVPVQTATITTPVGGANAGQPAAQLAVQTAAVPGTGGGFSIPDLPWGWIAAAAAAVFVIPKLTGGR